MKATFEVKKHILVPEQTKLNDKEKAVLLEKYHISVNNLPRILIKDKAISELKAKEKDVIKVIRQSSTAGIIEFYRVVVNG
ncbi:DNA-directed RNA polymerase subunit H [Candidatus Woesearchaeota archaeon]|nr:DNA-directed RNA polymerase subunit H [Candidatus Woesearchaeota archaeon]